MTGDAAFPFEDTDDFEAVIAGIGIAVRVGRSQADPAAPGNLRVELTNLSSAQLVERITT